MKSTIRVLGVSLCLAGIGYSGIGSSVTLAKDEPSKIKRDTRTISYQGILHENGSRVANGTYTITVSLYTDAEGSAMLWTDRYEASVTNGQYNLVLGSGNVPLPEPSLLDRELWLGVSVNGQQMSQITKLTAQPFALNVSDNSITTAKVQDGAITAEKMGTEYVRSIHINGQRVTGIGDELNIVAKEGIRVSYDEASKTVILARDVNRSGHGKDGTLADLTVDGNLTVNGNTDLGGNVIDPTIKFTGRSISNLNMNNNALTKVQSVGMGNPGTSATIQSHPQPGDKTISIPPTTTNADFVLTTGPQTINGQKTFSESTTFQGAVSIPTGPVTLPVSSVNNGNLENPLVVVNAGAGLTGGGYVTLGEEVTLTNDGVLTLTGTTNQVNVSASSGNITITGPQDLATVSSPTFNNLTTTGKITSAATLSTDPATTLTTRDYVDGIAAVTKACAIADANTYTNQSIDALKLRAINTGTGLTGGGNLTADRTLSLTNTGVAAGTYTNPSIAVDQQGRITSATSQTVVQAATLQTIAASNNFAGIKVAVHAGVPTEVMNVMIDNTAITSGSVVLVTVQDHMTPTDVRYIATIREGGITNGHCEVAIKRADNVMINNGEGCKVHYIVVN